MAGCEPVVQHPELNMWNVYVFTCAQLCVCVFVSVCKCVHVCAPTYSCVCHSVCVCVGLSGVHACGFINSFIDDRGFPSLPLSGRWKAVSRAVARPCSRPCWLRKQQGILALCGRMRRDWGVEDTPQKHPMGGPARPCGRIQWFVCNQ